MDIKIGICDDEVIVARQLRKRVKKVMEKRNRKCEVFTFLSGVELLKKVPILDLIFLDIEMPELDGIEIGREILKINPVCKIIIATGSELRFKETFKINTFRFITKPFDDLEIEEALDSYHSTLIGGEKISVFKDRIEYGFAQREISYVTAFNGYTEFYIGNKKYRKECSLNTLENVLNSRCFFRISKQCSVNMFMIQGYTKGLITICGMKIPVSRRKQKDFERKYIEFSIEHGCKR